MEADRSTDDNDAEARREVPRSRTPKATFSNSEAAAGDRRAGGTPPPVTFQPPPGAASDEPPARMPRKQARAAGADEASTRGQARRKGTSPEPAPAEAAPARPAKSAAPRPAKSAAPKPAKAAAPKRPRTLADSVPTKPAKRTDPVPHDRPVATPEVPTPTVQAEPAMASRTRNGLWSKVSIDPGHTPELLALAAVDTLGPQAQAWADRTRQAYPQADADALARLAVTRAMRLGALGGAAAALSGGFAVVTGMAASAWTQAALVLDVAAAYDQDPTDRARATDLLVLTGVHPSREAAADALAAALEAGAQAGPEAATWPGPEAAARRLGMPVLAQVSGWFALRTVNRLLPGSALLAATLGARSSAERLGTKAVAHYRAVRSS